MYLIFKKEGVFAKELGGIHESCFKTENPTEEFAKEGYTVEILNENEYQKLYDLDLETVKLRKIAEIKQARDAYVISNITTSKGLVFSANTDAQFRIYTTWQEWENIMKASNLDPQTDKMAWGSTGLVAQEDLQEAYILIQQRLARVCGIDAPALIEEVKACNSVEDVIGKKGKIVSKGVNSIEIKF